MQPGSGECKTLPGYSHVLESKCHNATIYPQSLCFYHDKRLHWVKNSYIERSKLWSCCFKANPQKLQIFPSHEGQWTPLTGAHCLAWIASPEDLIHWNYKKKFPSAAKQRTVSVHSLAASMRRIRVCIHLSVLQSLSSFTSLSVVPLLFHHSLGPRLCLFHPCQALFQRLSLGNCTAISNSLAFTIIKLVLPTHSLLPSLKAAPSVALPLNPACLKVSTWLHVHTPTLITV